MDGWMGAWVSGWVGGRWILKLGIGYGTVGAEGGSAD